MDWARPSLVGTGIAHGLAALRRFAPGRSVGAFAADAPRVTKQHPELTVLAYVTPWNARGKGLVDEYREKFDIVCPVWYTIHVDESQAGVYEVRGAPPT